MNMVDMIIKSNKNNVTLVLTIKIDFVHVFHKLSTLPSLPYTSQLFKHHFYPFGLFFSFWF